MDNNLKTFLSKHRKLNQPYLETFLSKQRKLNQENKAYFNNDALTLKSRKQAREKINKAITNGQINWKLFGTKLLTTNTKLQKIDATSNQLVLTVGLQLAPSFSSGYNTCSFASECAKICLDTSGHGQNHMMQTLPNGEKIHYVHVARHARTILLFEHKEQFKEQLIKEITTQQIRARRLGAILAVRLNVLSDIEWETVFPELWEIFRTETFMREELKKLGYPHTDVIFYDYAKNPFRKSTPNYPLTFSRNEINHDIMLQSNGNLAVVFNVKKGQPLPKTFKGRQVIDGDLHDNRFSDPQNIIVGLRAKGNAKNTKSNFVVKV